MPTLLFAWDMEDERRTLAKLRLDADVTVMAIDDLLRYGEADAEATARALTARVRAPEATEDAGKVLFGDADAGVGNGNLA